ncbi:hypothetical protein SNE40_020846 [Patella caerulea]
MEVLINLKGFDTNDGIRDHGIQVKTYGDTTHGCANTGYTYSADDGHGVQMLGDLGTVDEDVDGTMYTMIKNKKPKLAGQLSIIGRAVVVYNGAFNPHSQNPINAPILGCCVIGLSDGTRWTNPRNTDVIQAASNSGTRSGIHATNQASPSQSSTFHSMPHSSGFHQPASAHQPVTGFHGQQPHSQFNTQHHTPDHSFSGYSQDPHQQPHSQFNTEHSAPAHSFSGYNQAPHQDFGSDFGHSSLFGGGSIGQHQPVFSFGGNSQGQAHSRFNKGGSLGPHIPDFDKAQRTPIYKREEGDIRSPLFGESHKPLFSSSHNSFFPSFDHDTSFDQEKEDVLTSKDKEPEQVPNDAEYAPPDTYSPSSDGGHSSNSNGRYSDGSSNQDNSNGTGQYSDEGSSGQYSDEGSTQGKYAADGSTEGNSGSSGQYSDDGSTQKNTDSNGHNADESSTRGDSDHSGQYADDGSAEGNSGSSGLYSGTQENTGSTGQYADESSAQGNSDSSGQYADDGSAHGNSDSSGQYSDGGSTQEKSGSAGQYADESSDQGNSGSNGQYSDDNDKNGQYASNDNEESVDNDRSAAYVDGSHGNAHGDSTSGSLNDDSSSGSSSYSSSSSSSSGGDLSGVSSGDKADLQNEEPSRDDKGIAKENQETQANEGSQGGYIADIDDHGTHEVPGTESASLTTQTDGNENRRTERDPQNTENDHANVIEYPAGDANTSPSEETIRAPEPIISNPAQGNPSGSVVMAVPPPPHLYRSATEHDYPHPPEIQVPHHGGHYESPPLPPPPPSAPHAMKPETTEQTP